MSAGSQSVRPPAVAGRFYPADAAECRRMAASYLQTGGGAGGGRWIGGIVPHAGWICSGAIAGQTISVLAAQQGAVDVVVVFGAVHTPARIDFAALDSHASWAVPGGESALPVELERRLGERGGNLFAVDERLHRSEHAVEVEVPLLQLAFATASILPIEVPAVSAAELIGRKTAEVISAAGLRAVYLASSDLTHYGPNYRYVPAGVGEGAMRWTKENDRRLLGLVERMEIGGVIPEVKEHANACGAGAIVAMLAACRELGATGGRVLRHATSYETLAEVAPQPPNNAVGYASVVVG